jgi:hypothetical protein
MTNRRDFLSLSVAGLVGGLALQRASWGQAPVAAKTVDATSTANAFLQALPAEQREKVSFAALDAERFNWHFVPLNDTKTKSSTRKGVCLDDMNADARKAALELLKTGTSEDGYKWSRDIMEREAILGELEPNNLWFRKPGWYFFTVYGKPANTGAWGWRVDGHHLSISASFQDGKLVSSTPYFMGLNPVTIKTGKNAGQRETITASEDLGRELFLSLDGTQKGQTQLAEHLPEVMGKTMKLTGTLPRGLEAAKLNSKQLEKLLELVTHYTQRMPAELSKSELAKIVKAGVEKLSFAYSGEAAPGKRHTYVIQGPTFQIHYMNEMTDPQKNPANHIHSCFRTVADDFGGAKPA